MDISELCIGLVLLLLPWSRAEARCPVVCNCTRNGENNMVANCSSRGLTSVPHDLDQLDPDIHTLDLSHNRIHDLPKGTFSSLKRTSIRALKLNHNEITNLEPLTFSQLENLHTIDISNNRISILPANTFYELSGQDSDDNSLNLLANPLEKIEGNAFYFVRKLNVLIGHNGRTLTVNPSAFYGLTNIPLISFDSVPGLQLLTGAFTNTENLKLLHFHRVTFGRIMGFTFPGFTNLETLYFSECALNAIESFGFSGIAYKNELISYTDSAGPVSAITKKTQGGGLVKIEKCTIGTLPSDVFRDTNVARIYLEDNVIGTVQAHFLRGLSSLQSVTLVTNNISNLSSDALGSLVGVREIRLDRNELKSIGRHTFRETREVDSLIVHIKAGSHLVLEANAFSDALDVRELTISAERSPPAQPTSMLVAEDAFKDLVGVHNLNIVDIFMPNLTRHSFSGMAKVQTLRFVNCNISTIESRAFGPGHYGPGAVDALDLSSGNKLPCDCNTAKSLQEMEVIFTSVYMSCIDGNGGRQMRTRNTLRGLDSDLLACNSNTASVMTGSFSFISCTYLIQHILNWYLRPDHNI